MAGTKDGRGSVRERRRYVYDEACNSMSSTVCTCDQCYLNECNKKLIAFGNWNAR